MTGFSRLAAALVVLATVAYCITSVATPFNNEPPFKGADPDDWPNHPNSRHLDNDADTDALTMDTLVGPQWDVDQWECDDIVWNGGAGQGLEATWYDTRPSWPNHQGLVGIDNSTGGGSLTGSITFHVNNFEDPNYIKYVWDEIIFMTTGGASINVSLTTEPSATVAVQEIQNFSSLAEYGYDANDPGHLQNLYGEIIPNPLWEEITYTFNVGSGEEAYIDSFEFATICTPEPGSAALCCLVLMIVAMIRRRTR